MVLFVIVLGSTRGRLGEELLPGVLGGDESEAGELERAGVLRRPARKPTADMLRTLPPMPKALGSAVDAVLAERDEGR